MCECICICVEREREREGGREGGRKEGRKKERRREEGWCNVAAGLLLKVCQRGEGKKEKKKGWSRHSCLFTP